MPDETQGIVNEWRLAVNRMYSQVKSCPRQIGERCGFYDTDGDLYTEQSRTDILRSGAGMDFPRPNLLTERSL